MATWPDEHDGPDAAPESVAASPEDGGTGEPGARGRRRARIERTPLQTALGLLTRREHSRRELQRKLEARGHAGEAANVALDRLAEAGWQDDRRFAASLVRARAGAGYGPLRIRAELGMHGIDRDVVQAALDEEATDWNEAARDLAHRRFGAGLATDEALRRRAADFLLRRGFSGDMVRAATRWDPADD